MEVNRGGKADNEGEGGFDPQTATESCANCQATEEAAGHPFTRRPENYGEHRWRRLPLLYAGNMSCW
eukprot:12899706-Prorocentrum_lima.AAC.1